MIHARPGVPSRDIARRHAVFVLTLAMALATMGALCEPQTTSPPNQQQTKPETITRDRAIEIARAEARIATGAVEAVEVTSQGRQVWRVTLQRRLPDAPPELFETHIVEVDARTGEIIGVFRS